MPSNDERSGLDEFPNLVPGNTEDTSTTNFS